MNLINFTLLIIKCLIAISARLANNIFNTVFSKFNFENNLKLFNNSTSNDKLN